MHVTYFYAWSVVVSLPIGLNDTPNISKYRNHFAEIIKSGNVMDITIILKVYLRFLKKVSQFYTPLSSH